MTAHDDTARFVQLCAARAVPGHSMGRKRGRPINALPPRRVHLPSYSAGYLASTPGTAPLSSASRTPSDKWQSPQCGPLAFFLGLQTRTAAPDDDYVMWTIPRRPKK